MTKPVAIKSKDTYTIYINSRVFTINPRHKNYAEVEKALKEQRFDDIEALVDITTKVRAFTKKSISIKDGILYFKKEPINNSLTSKIIEMTNCGAEATPLILFMHNLMDNPAEFARQELYSWLETNRMPITPDGCFLAFKNVSKNFRDVYTGKIDNSVGKVVEMKREEVDPNRNNTCSRGLHFCAKEYLGAFSGERTLLLKINPRDVVSIPSDYNNQKGRCCRYEVVQELDRKGNAALEVATKFEEAAPPVMDLGSEFNKIMNKYRLKKGANQLQHLRAYLNKFLIKLNKKPISMAKLGKMIGVSDKTIKGLEEGSYETFGLDRQARHDAAVNALKKLAEEYFAA